MPCLICFEISHAISLKRSELRREPWKICQGPRQTPALWLRSEEHSENGHVYVRTGGQGRRRNGRQIHAELVKSHWIQGKLQNGRYTKNKFVATIIPAVICLSSYSAKFKEFRRVSFNIPAFKTSLTGTSGPERYQRSQPAERSPHRRVCSRQWDASCNRRQRRHDRHCRTLDRHREPVKCKPGCHAAICLR